MKMSSQVFDHLTGFYDLVSGDSQVMGQIKISVSLDNPKPQLQAETFVQAIPREFEMTPLQKA